MLEWRTSDCEGPQWGGVLPAMIQAGVLDGPVHKRVGRALAQIAFVVPEKPAMVHTFASLLARSVSSNVVCLRYAAVEVLACRFQPMLLSAILRLSSCPYFDSPDCPGKCQRMSFGSCMSQALE